MITPGMSEKEILKEFWRDYNNIISPRLFGWINGHKRIIKETQSRSKDGWASLKDIREIKTPGLNKYRCVVKAKIDKKLGPAFVATTYTITTDSSGRNKVHLLPTASKIQSLITFDSHFFWRYAEVTGRSGMNFIGLVDDFMKPGVNFHADICDDWKDTEPNFYVDLGGDRCGIGVCDYDNMTFHIKTFTTPSLLSSYAQELGIEDVREETYLEIYKAWKSRNKNKEVVEVPVVKEEEKSEKQKEIDAAWAEYYSLG